MVEFQLEGVFLVILIPQHGQKAQRGGVLHLGTINGKIGTLKGGETKNGGISDNKDNTRVTHRLSQGDLYGDVRAKRRGLSCCQVHLNLDSICSLEHFTDLFCSFWQFRVQSVATALNATGVYRQHLHVRTHAHFFSLRTLARQIWSHVWLKGLTICLYFNIDRVFVEYSFDPASSYFLITCCLTDATDWNQIEPLCNSALVWTVWPSGRSDPKHRNKVYIRGSVLLISWSHYHHSFSVCSCYPLCHLARVSTALVTDSPTHPRLPKIAEKHSTCHTYGSGACVSGCESHRGHSRVLCSSLPVSSLS